MEMDEVITQIQQWRQLRPMPNAELAKDDDITEHQEYHSQAYDSLFNNNGTKNWEGPETDGIDADCDFQTTATGSRKEKQYIPDEEMIQKVE